MKKILFFVLLLLSFVACDNGAGYNVCVKGSVEGGINDGDSIYLMQLNEQNIAEVKGRTAVRGGSFELVGNIAMPAVCNVVTFTPEGRLRRRMDFIAEGGEVAIKVLPDYYRVGGTPLNDALQACRDSMEIATRIYKRYYNKKAETPTLSSMGVKEADDVMSIASYQYRTKLYRAIERNIGNILAAYFIKNNIDIIEPTRALKFIKEMPAEYKDNVIVYLNKLYTAQEKYSEGSSYADFAMRDINGKKQVMSDYAGKGKPVLINVWLSGDKNSIEAQNSLFSLRGEYGKKLEMWGVSIDQNYNVWHSSVTQKNMCGIQVSDLKGWNSGFLSLYGVDKVPYFILIDGDGKISYRGTSLNDALSGFLQK